MQIDSLYLQDYRNYSELNVDFTPGVNLILGDNAQGKSNLLEAISYLSMGRAFRTRKEKELIRFGADFAQMEAQVTSQQRTQKIRAVLFAGSRPRQLWLNGVKKKQFAPISGVLTSVLFCPEDLSILKEGAATRRKFLDQALCGLRPGYDKALSEYGKIIDGKTRILKDRYENPGLLEILPEYNARLCQVGAILISYRARFIDALNQAAGEFHADFTGNKEKLTLSYQTVSTVADSHATLPQLNDYLREHLESHQWAELDSGQCLTGPHKDDFDAFLNGINAKSYGSQGQIRTAAISLKLAQREIFRREFGEEPVLLLDDVLSELDPVRQDFVLNRIKSGQVFITCCEPGRFTKLGKTIEIRNGHLAE